jgi:NAD(P)-dependent dehydrogenase (short-subunit alcohol dehydrogenase family)
MSPTGVRGTQGVAVVTGGASGLGAAIVDALRADGRDVVVADLLGDAPVDVTRASDVESLFDRVRRDHGRLDVLVCSAAVETRASVLDTSDAEWQHVLDVNLKAPFLCLKHGLPLLADSGGGSVVLMGSVLGSIGSPQYAAYCASKGALVNLAKQAAIEHAPDGIRVNVLSPSAVEAGLFLETVSRAPDPEAIKRMVAGNNPMGRLGSVKDVTAAVRFLTGDGSAYISGTVVPLDGGMAARRS